MPTTYTRAIGVHSGTRAELDITTGSPLVITSPAPPTGTYAINCNTGKVTIKPFRDISDAGDKQVLGIDLRVTTPSREVLRGTEGAGFSWAIRIEGGTPSGFKFQLQNSIGTVIATSTKTDFTTNTYYSIRLVWDHLNAGAFEVWVDGVLQIDVSSGDFDGGGTFDGYRVNSWQHFNNVFCASGVASAADVAATWEVKGVVNAKTGSTPDAGAFATAGTALDAGTWPNVAEIPFSETNTGSYTTSNVGGSVDSAAITVDGEVALLTGLWHAKRGTGTTTVHSGVLGKGSDGNNAPTNTLALLETFADYIVTRNTDLPSGGDKIRQGFWTDGAQDIVVGDMLAHFLDVPASASGIAVTPSPATAVAATVDPTVVLGAVAVSPAPAAAIGTVVDPAVVLGGIAVAPAPAASIAAVVDPTVVFGGVAVTPSPATGVAAAVDPAIVLGAMTVLPSPAAAIGSKADPVVLDGGGAVIPAPATAVAAVVDPTVVLGSVAVIPAPATAVAATVDPTVQSGGIAVVPAAAGAVAGKADPIVVAGSLVLTPPPAAAVSGIVAPTVGLGAVTASPAPAAAIGAVVDPVVMAGILFHKNPNRTFIARRSATTIARR